MTVYVAAQSAIWPAFAPSDTCPLAVYVPGAAVFVSMFATFDVPEIVPPSADHVYVGDFFGFRFSAVPVTVSGSPGKTESGEAEQEYVTGGGGMMWPKCVTMPVLNSAPLMFARPPMTPDVGGGVKGPKFA